MLYYIYNSFQKTIISIKNITFILAIEAVANIFIALKSLNNNLKVLVIYSKKYYKNNTKATIEKLLYIK